MKNNDFNSGELHVGTESKNRHTSSSFINDTKKSSIAIIASIVVLAIIACTFFAVFGNISLPAWKFDFDADPQPPEDPPENTKPTFVATEGGKGMYQMDLSSEYAILVKLSDMSTVAHKYADGRRTGSRRAPA